MPEGIKKIEKQSRSKQKAIGVNPRVAFSFLIVLSVITLGLGFWQIGNTIRAPFIREDSNIVGANGRSPVQGEDEDILALQQKDTDNDGLNDYEELYVYNTSPYLPDSDSDGFSDSEEIKSDNDPNCPAGQDCRGTAIGKTNEDSTGIFGDGVFNPAAQVLQEDILGQQFGGDVSGDQAASTALKNLTPDQIRQLLRDSGQIDEAALSQIDDATLMEVFGEVMGQQ